MKMYHADAQAFLDLPGKPLIADRELKLNLGLVTVAPPSGPGGRSLNTSELLGFVEGGRRELDSQKGVLRVIL